MSLHVGDIGTVVEIELLDNDTAVDISTNTALEIVFKKPDQSVTRKTAALSADGKDGKIRYSFVSGDLDQAGTWHMQGFVQTAASCWTSDETSFTVSPILS